MSDPTRKRPAAPRPVQGKQGVPQAQAENQTVLQDVLALNQKIISCSPMGILAFHAGTGRCVLANEAAATLTGLTVPGLLALSYDDVAFLKEEGILDVAEDVVATGQDRQIDLHRINSFGREVWWMIHLTLFTEQGEPHILALVHDLTARKLSEAALARIQKMESLGLMAGGIAHDFNNHFQVILANLERARQDLGEPGKAAPSLDRARQALQKSVDMAQRMLDYSGKGFRQAVPLDLSEVVLNNAEFLQDLVPGHLSLEVRLADQLPMVEGDPNQLNQVIAALVLNAAEAMHGLGGVITLATQEEVVTPEEAGSDHWTVRPPAGRAVALSVGDDGEGMAKEVLARAFDPFFSTRAPGRGLGLPAALGIIQAHQGGLAVESRPGHGTMVRILLPLAGSRPAFTTRPKGPAAAPQGRTILLVDDDDDIRADMGEIVASLFGHKVLQAKDGPEAIELYRREGGTIALILMDATMSRMTGAETFEAIKKLNPAARAVLCSGFSAETGRETAKAHGFLDFLKKPFTIGQLRETVERALAALPGT